MEFKTSAITAKCFCFPSVVSFGFPNPFMDLKKSLWNWNVQYNHAANVFKENIEEV